jgi:hypothetical protein
MAARTTFPEFGVLAGLALRAAASPFPRRQFVKGAY